MPEQRDDREATFAELSKRLAELEASRPRSPPPLFDRMVRRLGEAEIAVGVLMLILTPLDAISVVLSTIGGFTWIHERFIKEPREARDAIERSRQIDLIKSELDRLRRR